VDDSVTVPRLQLLELEDQAWFPAAIRDLATDYLHYISTALDVDRAAAPLVEQALRDSGATHIVDLCSGGSGPLPELVRTLRERRLPVRATLTDLYPNVPAFERVVAASGGLIDYVSEPIDACAVPARLQGLRTLFNAFHHFAPSAAAAILRGAVEAAQPIAIFELSERTPRNIFGVVLVPLFVWATTPFIRPFRWDRLLWTYPLPLVPFTCLWDGVVSQLRAYTPQELERLGAEAGRMRWNAGQVPIANGRGRLTYLIGLPM
jgi:hypothetical protein